MGGREREDETDWEVVIHLGGAPIFRGLGTYTLFWMLWRRSGFYEMLCWFGAREGWACSVGAFRVMLDIAGVVDEYGISCSSWPASTHVRAVRVWVAR